jgi:asparagine synthase (glutamine-hydrolysing)
MCGIVGVIDFERPAHLHAPAVQRMAAALRHRGPDAEGIWLGRHAALGHTRLWLLDREGGTQPMQDPTGRHVLVYNGEVYNHAELRRELRERWEFRTRSDTEVVLAALACWGEAALPRFNGMFALAWWDEHEQRGLLARDRLGVKPLAYEPGPHGVRFASEAKALVATMAGRPRAAIPALLEVLAAPCLSGSSPAFAGLRYLQPGELVRVDRTGLHAHTWAPLRIAADRDDDALVPELRAAVEAAVRRSLRGDVPVGVFLSGGLDSTLVAAVAARHAKAPPRAVTIAFEGHAEHDYSTSSRIVISDDAPFARLAAEQLELPQTWVRVPTASIAEVLPELARIDDAVPAWEQQLAQHHLAHAAARHDRAMLVGDAADETHYGYHFLLDEDATRSPLALLRRFPSVPIHPDHGPDVQARIASELAGWQAAHAHAFDPTGDDPRARILATTWLLLRRWLPRLLHNGDVHGMAASIEVRVPFADTELVDLALRVDPGRAYRAGEEKALLRQVARDLVPEAIRVRRKSALPKDQRAADAYKAIVRRCLDEDPSLPAALCDLPAVRALLQPRRPLDEGERAILFRVAALALWQRAYDVAPP